MYKHTEWLLDEACKDEKELLMTLGKIRKERKDNDDDMLDDDQADKMRDCWQALCKIYHVRNMIHEAKAKGHMVMPSVAGGA